MKTMMTSRSRHCSTYARAGEQRGSYDELLAFAFDEVVDICFYSIGTDGVLWSMQLVL